MNVRQFHILRLLIHIFGYEEVAQATGYLDGPYDRGKDYSKYESFKALHHDLSDSEKRRIQGLNTETMRAIQLTEWFLMCLNNNSIREKFEQIPSYKKVNNWSLPNAIALGDLRYWTKLTSWTPKTAVALSMGVKPYIDDTVFFDELVSKEMSNGFTEELQERLIILNSALENEDGENSKNPMKFIEIFERLQLPISPNLASEVRRIYGLERATPHESADSKLTDMERKSLLKLVAGMAIGGYRFDPDAKRNDATSDIQSDLDQIGIGLDQKTILKWLREATAYVDSRKET